MRIIKRNGSEVEFQIEKIKNAIRGACSDVDEANRMTNREIDFAAENVTERCMNAGHIVTVEEVQDLVENQLMALNHFEVARAYITWRYEHAKARAGNTTDAKILSIVDCTNELAKQENSNKDTDVVSVQRDYVAGEVSRDITVRKLLPPEIVKAHEEGLIHFHDSDYFLQRMHNCDLINLEDMLQNGTVISGTMIERPHSFSTACNIATQIIAQVASCQYGGQSISLAHLAPFVDVSRQKIRRELIAELEKAHTTVDDAAFNTMVEARVKREIQRGIQTIQYQIITLMTTNGQAPFITVFMYIDEVPEGQTRDDLVMCIEEMLRQRYQGVKNEEGVWITPAFPKLIYVLDEDNVHEDSQYFWLTQMAAKCTAKRMVPDYISAKKMRELKLSKGEKPGEGDVYTCMGCVIGDEVVTYQYHGKTYVESIERMWNRMRLLSNDPIQKYGQSDYIDTPELKIWDSEKRDFVACKRIIRNDSHDWCELTFSNGRILDCTPDHPFETQRGVVRADQLTADDVIQGDFAPMTIEDTETMSTDTAWLLGLILCDGSYDNHIVVSVGTDEADVAEHMIACVASTFEAQAVTKTQRRGQKGTYLDVSVKPGKNVSVTKLAETCMSLFGGHAKRNRHIPSMIFSCGTEARLAFLAGMIDADGYINDNMKLTKIQLGSTNRELAEQQMLLAQSCGMRAHLYRNHYHANKHDCVRYRVEFIPTPELINYVVSAKKRAHVANCERTNDSRATRDTCQLTNRVMYEKDAFSYDVTTASEHFTVAGLYSHNCRSFLTPDRSGNGFSNVARAKNYDPNKPKYYGRFNQGVVTINLPDVALSAHGDEDKFWEIFDERLELCHKALRCRHERLKGTLSDAAPILWQYGALARLDKGETIDKLLYGGYSTISLGYAGLYECTMAMKGVSHTDPAGKPFALAVMQRMNDKCSEWKAAEDIDYSLYGTPWSDSWGAHMVTCGEKAA